MPGAELSPPFSSLSSTLSWTPCDQARGATRPCVCEGCLDMILLKALRWQVNLLCVVYSCLMLSKVHNADEGALTTKRVR